MVQPYRGGQNDPERREEFAELARSAGAEVLGEIGARVDTPNARFFIGTGKVDEVKALKTSLDADLILVNHTLSSVQERNLEKYLECRVIDRTGLILDIFAQRARSHEGKLQVELAQLKHTATRLVRGWTHLERQRGGSIGLRGPGETQLETDRRLLSKRVDLLEARLLKVEVQRDQARRQRSRGQLPVIAVVGYTNAGKSTLFNALTTGEVYVADQLFATLDPTVRRLQGLQSGPAVLADTVGFIRDLPHDLIAAFRSTLSEAREADLLLHIVDAADPERDERIKQVQAVLDEIGAGDLPQLFVYNKIDRLEDVVAHRERIEGGTVHRVWLSALRREGLELLRGAIGEALAPERVRGELQLPSSCGRLRARLFAAGVVASESFTDNAWRLSIDAPRNQVEPLFGLPDGDGAWLRERLGRPEDSYL